MAFSSSGGRKLEAHLATEGRDVRVLFGGKSLLDLRVQTPVHAPDPLCINRTGVLESRPNGQ